MRWTSSATLLFTVALVLSGCDEDGNFILDPDAGQETAADGTAAPQIETIERDVEAPDVFQAAEAGLWDGRPSLGGVWVAHPDVDEPERVLIRNATNGNEVVGALFKRERNNLGPRIQVSSDAASSLGMLAGQPVRVEVVALRRETFEVPVAGSEETVETAEADAIEEATLDPIEAAAAAIDEAEAGGTAVAATGAAAASASAATTTTASAAPASSLDRPFVQIGIFSIEANANNTAASLRNIGIVPTIRRQESRGNEFWRVIVGPATTRTERADVLRKVKDLGFTDAYFVSN